MKLISHIPQTLSTNQIYMQNIDLVLEIESGSRSRSRLSRRSEKRYSRFRMTFRSRGISYYLESRTIFFLMISVQGSRLPGFLPYLLVRPLRKRTMASVFSQSDALLVTAMRALREKRMGLRWCELTTHYDAQFVNENTFAVSSQSKNNLWLMS